MAQRKGLSEEARKAEELAQIAVKTAIEETLKRGNPVARFDFELQKPYLEYPDGRREYDIE